MHTKSVLEESVTTNVGLLTTQKDSRQHFTSEQDSELEIPVINIQEENKSEKSEKEEPPNLIKQKNKEKMTVAMRNFLQKKVASSPKRDNILLNFEKEPEIDLNKDLKQKRVSFDALQTDNTM